MARPLDPNVPRVDTYRLHPVPPSWNPNRRVRRRWSRLCLKSLEAARDMARASWQRLVEDLRQREQVQRRRAGRQLAEPSRERAAMLSGEVQRDLMEADAHQYAWMETVDQRVREVVHREEPDELLEPSWMQDTHFNCRNQKPEAGLHSKP